MAPDGFAFSTGRQPSRGPGRRAKLPVDVPAFSTTVRDGHIDASVFLPHKVQYARRWAAMLIDAKEGPIEFT